LWGALLVVGGFGAVGCGGSDAEDGGAPGTPQPAPGFDAGVPDAGAPDAAPPDAGAPDAGAPDAGPAPTETDATVTAHPFAHEVLEVGMDAAGDTHVLLRYQGTPDFQGTSLPNDGSGALQNAVVRLDGALRATAVRVLPPGGSQEAGDEGPRGPRFHLAVLPDGSVALGGRFSDALVTPVGTLPGRPFPESTGLLALIGPDGTWRWARALDSERSLSVVDVAASGLSIAVAGSFSGAAPLLGSAGAAPGVERQGFLLRVDLTGATRTVHTFTGSVRGHGAGVALGPAEDTFVAGHTVVTTAAGAALLTPYLARVNANGGVVWAKRFGEFSGQLDRVAVGPDGSVASTGRLNTEREVRWGETLLATPAARSVLLVTAYDGPPRWGLELGRALLGVGLAVDARGLVTVGGRALGTLDFGGGARGTPDVASLFLARLSPQGRHQWSLALPLPDTSLGTLPPLDLAVHAQGEARVAAGTQLLEVVPR
ncbi:MAG TPA: hypothetical protein VFO83_03985, partial [Aggregicoccus sp.]|nr:hypothetical protein [Aggregicoccus sp.]